MPTCLLLICSVAAGFFFVLDSAVKSETSLFIPVEGTKGYRA